MTSDIKRGVSLYSFQHETFQGKMSLEDCFKTCANMGALGIEIIGEQTFWGWPEASVDEAKIDEWHALIKISIEQKASLILVVLFGSIYE